MQGRRSAQLHADEQQPLAVGVDHDGGSSARSLASISGDHSSSAVCCKARGGRSAGFRQGSAPKISKKRKFSRQHCTNINVRVRAIHDELRSTLPQRSRTDHLSDAGQLAHSQGAAAPAINYLYGKLPAATSLPAIFRKFSADKSNFKEIVHQFTGINPSSVQQQLPACYLPPAPHLAFCRCSTSQARNLPHREANLLANAVPACRLAQALLKSLRTLETISAYFLFRAGSSPQTVYANSQGLLQTGSPVDEGQSSASQQLSVANLQSVVRRE
ncbi:hypothetical protein L7F22_002109 [Adiantum nelumboides]|nr:hypothetical protein [Adiantum nelumboides]